MTWPLSAGPFCNPLRQGRGEPAQAERTEKKERMQTKQTLRRTCLRRPPGPDGTEHRRGEEKPRPTPREERGKKTEEEKERSKAEPENGETKNSLDHKHKFIRKRTPRIKQKHRQYKKRSSCSKTCRKTRRNKKGLRKTKVRQGDFFPLSGNQNNGISGGFGTQKQRLFREPTCKPKSDRKIRNKTAPKRQGRQKKLVLMGKKRLTEKCTQSKTVAKTIGSKHEKPRKSQEKLDFFA